MADRPPSNPNAEKIPLTIRDLQQHAADSQRGLSTIYLPGEGFKLVESGSREARDLLPSGSQEIVHLTPDLLLARTDLHEIPDTTHEQQWALDYRGWLFLHFRLDGLSREIAPDGRVTTLGGQSFLLSASTGPASTTRQVLGNSWKTVGIACKPAFLSRELGMSADDLPLEVRRFQAGDPDISFWYAGELTHEMAAVANSLMQPMVHSSVRSVYLRAKTVELVCLALDRLRQPEPVVASTIRLSRHDVSCLHFARQILDDLRKPPSLDELARRVGINRNKLAMGFKHVFGLTVGEYHRELRLQRAYASLQDPDMKIGRVADEAGYDDAGSFSKVFKSRFGLLPSEVKPAPSIPGAPGMNDASPIENDAIPIPRKSSMQE